jgi:hypothetical protein
MMASSSYATIPNFNMNNSYDARLCHNQPNPHFINYNICFKCNNVIFLEMGQFYQCTSCGRLCCTSCMSNLSFPSNYYQCEYCNLNRALDTAYSH